MEQWTFLRRSSFQIFRLGQIFTREIFFLQNSCFDKVVHFTKMCPGVVNSRKEKMKLIMNQFWQGGSGLGVEKWCDVIGWEKNSFH